MIKRKIAALAAFVLALNMSISAFANGTINISQGGSINITGTPMSSTNNVSSDYNNYAVPDYSDAANDNDIWSQLDKLGKDQYIVDNGLQPEVSQPNNNNCNGEYITVKTYYMTPAQIKNLFWVNNGLAGNLMSHNAYTMNHKDSFLFDAYSKFLNGFVNIKIPVNDGKDFLSYDNNLNHAATAGGESRVIRELIKAFLLATGDYSESDAEAKARGIGGRDDTSPIRFIDPEADLRQFCLNHGLNPDDFNFWNNKLPTSPQYPFCPGIFNGSGISTPILIPGECRPGEEKIWRQNIFDTGIRDYDMAYQRYEFVDNILEYFMNNGINGVNVSYVTDWKISDLLVGYTVEKNYDNRFMWECTNSDTGNPVDKLPTAATYYTHVFREPGNYTIELKQHCTETNQDVIKGKKVSYTLLSMTGQVLDSSQGLIDSHEQVEYKSESEASEYYDGPTPENVWHIYVDESQVNQRINITGGVVDYGYNTERIE